MTKSINNHTSLSQRLHERLLRLIADTEPGSRLPSEPELAKQMEVSRATLREAMRIFETQGLIRRRQGSGTYVIHPSQVIESGLEILESIETMANRIGMPVTMGDFKIEHIQANDEELRALALRPGESIIRLSRVIQAEGHPAAFLVDSLPENVFSVNDLESSFTGSVLDLLLKRGDPPLSSSRCEINAVTASSEIARALEIQRGDVLLLFVAFLYAMDGRIIDYSYSYFLPGYFRFHVVRRIGNEMVR